jgi:RNA polymerase sigma-70 factor (ECF subfamily)
MDPSVNRFEAGKLREPPGPAPCAACLTDPEDDVQCEDASDEEGDGQDAGDVGDVGDVADAGDGAVARPAHGFAESLDNPALAGLIQRVMRQDEAAFAALYEQLSGRVYAVALHITRQVACAEEVLQDTFWQVWRQAPRFDPQRGSAVAWVLTMARSRALDAARSRARDPVQTSAQSVDDEDLFTDEAADDPLDLLHTVRRDSALHAQLALLDPLRRQLIALAFFRGMTQDEIAVHTGLPLGTVKSHFRRTLAALQSALGPDFSLTPAGGTR